MLHDLLKQSRIDRGLSIDDVAAALNVAPDAVRRWESGADIPNSQQLANLTVLYELPLRTLYSALKDTDAQTLAEKRPHVQAVPKAGRIKLAIVCQTILLMGIVQLYDIMQATNVPDDKLITLYIPLLAASLWMAFNQRYETNATQRRHNTKVELKYCLVQCGITLLGIVGIHPLLISLALCASSLYYINTVNPRRMNRPLFSQ